MEDLVKRIAKLEERVDELEKIISGSNTRQNTALKPQEKMSLNEFLKTKKLTDDVKRTLAIAYWLDYFERIDSFNTSDIEHAFRAGRLAVPKNVNDKINMNIKNGHVAENKEKKEGKKSWYVTNSGAELVENGLDRKGEKVNGRRAS